VPLPGGKTHLTLAKVAGFYRAAFGLPAETNALLVEHESESALFASAQLSRFITARYSPSAAWIIVWQKILRWLLTNQDQIEIRATVSVRPAFSLSALLPADAEKNTVANAVEWYFSARLFIHPSWAHKLEEAAVFEDRFGLLPRRIYRSGMDGSA
jgi:hypothetical protein